MERVMYHSPFVGIDWGGYEHQLCVVKRAGETMLELRVAHDVAGLGARARALTDHDERILVSVERAEALLVGHLRAQGHPAPGLGEDRDRGP